MQAFIFRPDDPSNGGSSGEPRLVAVDEVFLGQIQAELNQVAEIANEIQGVFEAIRDHPETLEIPAPDDIYLQALQQGLVHGLTQKLEGEAAKNLAKVMERFSDAYPKEFMDILFGTSVMIGAEYGSLGEEEREYVDQTMEREQMALTFGHLLNGLLVGLDKTIGLRAALDPKTRKNGMPTPEHIQEVLKILRADSIQDLNFGPIHPLDNMLIYERRRPGEEEVDPKEFSTLVREIAEFIDLKVRDNEIDLRYSLYMLVPGIDEEGIVRFQKLPVTEDEKPKNWVGTEIPQFATRLDGFLRNWEDAFRASMEDETRS